MCINTVDQTPIYFGANSLFFLKLANQNTHKQTVTKTNCFQIRCFSTVF